MTPEELDEARAKEAQRLWESGQEAGSSSWVVAARALLKETRND